MAKNCKHTEVRNGLCVFCAMPISELHKPTSVIPPDQSALSRIIIRAPNGAKFSFWGNDMYLEFQKGKELEVVDHLRHWIDTYVEPMARYYIMLEEQQLSLPEEKKEENNGKE